MSETPKRYQSATSALVPHPHPLQSYREAWVSRAASFRSEVRSPRSEVMSFIFSTLGAFLPVGEGTDAPHLHESLRRINSWQSRLSKGRSPR